MVDPRLLPDIKLSFVFSAGDSSYPLSYRHLEELMPGGPDVDCSSINRWAVLFPPLLEKSSGNINAQWV
jgi:hypothetical protein